MATWPLGATHSPTSVSPSPGFPPALPLSTDASSPLAMSEDVEEETEEEEEEQERWEFVSGSTVTPHSPLPTFLSIQPIFRYQLLSEGRQNTVRKELLGRLTSICERATIHNNGRAGIWESVFWMGASCLVSNSQIGK